MPYAMASMYRRSHRTHLGVLKPQEVTPNFVERPARTAIPRPAHLVVPLVPRRGDDDAVGALAAHVQALAPAVRALAQQPQLRDLHDTPWASSPGPYFTRLLQGVLAHRAWRKLGIAAGRRPGSTHPCVKSQEVPCAGISGRRDLLSATATGSSPGCRTWCVMARAWVAVARTRYRTLT